MIGVDIVSLERLKLSYLSVASRILSLRELEELALRTSEKEKIEYVGGRFASKEAYIKASGNKSASYKDIEILNDESGRPHLYYQEEEIGEVSIAHDGYAVSFVEI